MDFRPCAISYFYGEHSSWPLGAKSVQKMNGSLAGKFGFGVDGWILMGRDTYGVWRKPIIGSKSFILFKIAGYSNLPTTR